MWYRWSLASSLGLMFLLSATASTLAQAEATATSRAAVQATATALAQVLVSDRGVCSGFTSELGIGSLAQVRAGMTANLLASSDTGGEVLAIISGGEQVIVTGGPVCADGVTFWTVVYGGRNGWVAEALDSNSFVVMATPVATRRPSNESRGMVELPITGETPWWRVWVVAVLLGALTAGLSWVLIKMGRRAA